MLGSDQATVTYLIPGRTLTGPPQHVLDQLDEMVESLLVFRQLVAARQGGDFTRDSRRTGNPPTAR